MRSIKINGHILDGSLMIDDPDVKRKFWDASGNERHVRIFSDPVKLKAYVKRHPEGIVLAGTGVFFFEEPVPVYSSAVRFDKDGNADILVTHMAREIEAQLTSIDGIRAAAQDISMTVQSKQKS